MRQVTDPSGKRDPRRDREPKNGLGGATSLIELRINSLSKVSAS